MSQANISSNVVAAHEQYDKGNWNTWEYNHPPLDGTPVTITTRGDQSVVTCGDFSCICPIGKEMVYEGGEG